jgi:hypothetical protein
MVKTRPSAQKIKPPKWEYVVLGLIVFGLILLGIAGTIVSNRIKEPRKVSDRFVHSVLSKEPAAAYELTAEPYRQAMSPLEFRAVVDEFNETINTQPKVIDHQIERTPNDVLLATVIYDIPGTDGRRLIVKLIKENDNWRVLTINNLR